MTDDENAPRLVVSWLPSADADAATLVRSVAHVAGLDVADVHVVHACRSCGSDQHGKPHVVLPADPRLYVSLSRSAGLAVIAVTDAGHIGVDVEAVLPNSPDDLTAWVRTESLVKATGHGLTIDPALLDDESRWSVDLEAPDGFVAAVTILTDAPPIITTVQAAPEA